MRFSPRTWSLLSLLLFIAAAFFWLKGNEYEARKRQHAPAPAPSVESGTNNSGAKVDLLSTKTAGVTLARLGFQDKEYPLRLRNTPRTVDELVRDDQAVLLANALIDTTGAPLEIPEHLRAAADPGTYIVQWMGPTSEPFRKLLADHDAAIVSYVPNNAYLVRASKADAEALRGAAGVQAVLPFEPYFKLQEELLKLAVDQQPLPADAWLRVTLVPGMREAALNEIPALGGELLAEENSPFGPQLIIRPAADSLPSLARLAAVQGIEPDLARKPAADLSRIMLGVATNSTASNYLNLTGSNIWVNINDTAIDTNHPALSGRTFLSPPFPVSTNVFNTDPDGHGTFVAGLIAGNGAEGPSSTNTPSGSATNASFRGMAPLVKIFAQPIDPAGEEVYPKVKDTWLIETAAATNYLAMGRTNALISNNSWTYGVAGYDSAAARYDAAVRDAVPGSPGAQPLLFVFAAGNAGFGDDEGSGGQLGRIESPGSAKNVITVGALESPRLIQISYTNETLSTNLDGETTTNTEVIYPYVSLTDSSNQVASFSSRGNVGIGIEGSVGRFKPDVVAPGAMLVSLKSRGWNVTNSVDTNTPFGEAFASLHTNLTQYRLDSGTTFAAANVSGMLALIQEYFESRAPNDARSTALSPALLKAILLNGTRSLTEFYDIAVRSSANFQGWGVPRLPNSLSSYSTNSHAALAEEKWRQRYVDQNAENALTTGESRTWRVTMSTNGSVFPLRVTLVWTDPPGNPAVGVKLVNDLDLIITNVETKTVFYGNDFFPGSNFTEATRDPQPDILPLDSVNNVENIFIRTPSEFGREFTITVRARRVNVNAVNNFLDETGHSQPVQDFALVIGSDMGEDPLLDDQDIYFAEEELFDEFIEPTATVNAGRPPVTTITNGLPLLTERVGANPTVGGLNVTNGASAQWNFYVFTNINVTNELVTARAGPYVAFVTFNPPNLSRPREVEADIDVYVSTDPTLTNLNPDVLRTAFTSKERGGTETVAFTNARIGSVYYVGVKSEDQEGAEFSLMGVSSERPFEEERNGRLILNAVPVTSVLLDGSPNRPTASTLVAIGLSNRRVARAIVTNIITHENLGDLVGVLAHQGVRTVLNNHTLNDGLFSGTNIVLAYDDFTWGPGTGTRRSDGPGTLGDFSGTKIVGSWIIEQIDNAAGHTGRVESVTIELEPLQDPLLSGQFISGTVDGGEIDLYPIDLAPGVTNLVFTFNQVTAGRTLEVYLRAGEIPQMDAFDFRTNIVGPGGTFSFPTASSDPLAPGTYFLGIRNPVVASTPISYSVRVEFGFDRSAGNQFNFTGSIQPVLDDAVSRQTIQIDDDKLVAAARVSVNMPHPRSSDTVLSLLTPQGTRVLLAENRGLTNRAGFGVTATATNGTNVTVSRYYTVFTDDTNLARLPVKFVDLGDPVGVGGGSVIFTNGFEGPVASNYIAGASVGGWSVFSAAPQGTVSIISGRNYANAGTNLLSLGNGIIRTNISVTRNQAYKISFSVRAAPLMMPMNTGVDDQGTVLPRASVDPHYQVFHSLMGPDVVTAGPRLNFAPNNSTSSWVIPRIPNPPPATVSDGLHTYRTYINMYEQSTPTITPRLRWSASDDLLAEVRLNGNLQNIPPARPNAISSAPYQPLGGLRGGLNILEFTVDDLLASIRVEFAPLILPAPAPKLEDPTLFVDVGDGGVRRQITGTTNWTTVTVDYVATNTGPARLQFESALGEVWIDNIIVESTGDIFVQPEEPLANIQGERAIGEWALEVRDARTGAVLPAADILSWKLDLIYAQPVLLAERLVEGNNFPLSPSQINPTNRMRGGILFTNQTHYFVVYPCEDAAEVTLTLSGINNIDAIEMLVDHSGIPTGDPETDDFVPLRNNENPGGGGGEAVFTLNWDEPAPAKLIPGKPFFVAVRNRFINTTNVYTLRVDSDRSCNFPSAFGLSANATVSSVVAPQSAGAATEGDLFEANVAEGALEISFKVEAEGDVMIVAQKGNVPSRESYSHIQNVVGSGDEELRITASSTVPLTPGQWFVRVLNNDTDAVAYSITASGDLAAPVEQTRVSASYSGGHITLLWNSVPGASYIVEHSTDLVDWHPAATVQAEGAVSSHTADAANVSQRFYRVVRQ